MFFSKIPKTKYDFYGNGGGTTIPNIFMQIRPKNDEFNYLTTYNNYIVQNERPDQVSYELYGTIDHYWTFFIINPHLSTGLHGWAMSHNTFNNYMNETYKGYSIRPFREHEDNIDYNSLKSGIENGTEIFLRREDADSLEIGIVNEVDYKTNQIHFDYVKNVSKIDPSKDKITIGDWDIDDKFLVTNRQSSVHSFKNANNYENLKLDVNDILTIKQFESDKNDDKARIKVIRKPFIDEFSTKYRQLING